MRPFLISVIMKSFTSLHLAPAPENICNNLLKASTLSRALVYVSNVSQQRVWALDRSHSHTIQIKKSAITQVCVAIHSLA